MHALDFKHPSYLTKFINFLLNNVVYCSFPWLLPGKTIEMYKEYHLKQKWLPINLRK